MGQKGTIDRIPVAHSKAIMALEWTHPHHIFRTKSTATLSQSSSTWYGGVGAGLFDDLGGFGVMGGTANVPANTTSPDGDNTSMGWLASGGLDHTVKVYKVLWSRLICVLTFLDCRFGI